MWLEFVVHNITSGRLMILSKIQGSESRSTQPGSKEKFEIANNNNNEITNS